MELLGSSDTHILTCIDYIFTTPSMCDLIHSINVALSTHSDHNPTELLLNLPLLLDTTLSHRLRGTWSGDGLC